MNSTVNFSSGFVTIHSRNGCSAQWFREHTNNAAHGYFIYSASNVNTLMLLLSKTFYHGEWMHEKSTTYKHSNVTMSLIRMHFHSGWNIHIETFSHTHFQQYTFGIFWSLSKDISSISAAWKSNMGKFDDAKADCMYESYWMLLYVRPGKKTFMWTFTIQRNFQILFLLYFTDRQTEHRYLSKHHHVMHLSWFLIFGWYIRV